MVDLSFPHGGAIEIVEPEMQLEDKEIESLLGDLTLLKEFKMKPGTDDNGVLRWMHDDHGFVFRLKDTLSTLPAEYFDKADWEPVISDVLMEASEIIGHQDWPNELGLGAYDEFSKDVLSSGLQA
eukprot:COSAG06_NODE_39903_length_407_cov_1.246753_1_plen_124_part_01